LSEKGKIVLGSKRDVEELKEKIEAFENELTKLLSSIMAEITKIFRGLAEEAKSKMEQFTEEFRNEVVNRGLGEIEKTFGTVKSEVKRRISPLRDIIDRFSEATDIFVLPDRRTVEQYMIDVVGKAKSSLFAVVPADMENVLSAFSTVKPTVSVQIVTDKLTDQVSKLTEIDNIKVKILPELECIGVSRDREEVVFACIEEEIKGVASTMTPYIDLLTRILRESWLKAKPPA